MSGTCRKLLVLGLAACGDNNAGTGRAKSSATGTCGDPKPAWMPYSISWNTLKFIGKNICDVAV